MPKRVNPDEQPTAPRPQQPEAPNPPRDLLRIDRGWREAVRDVLHGGRPRAGPKGRPGKGRPR